MEKMKKSVKIVLISVVSALLVFGIVLGCILGSKSNPNNPNNPNASGFNSELFNELASDIKTSYSVSMDNFDVIDSLVYNKINNGLTYNDIKEYADNYFIARENINGDQVEHFYSYYYTTNGNLKYCKITDTVSNGGFVKDNAVSFKVLDYNDKYIAIESVLSNEMIDGMYYPAYYSLIYFDCENPVEVYSFEIGDEYESLWNVTKTINNNGDTQEVRFAILNEYFIYSIVHSYNDELESAKIDVIYATLPNNSTKISENNIKSYKDFIFAEYSLLSLTANNNYFSFQAEDHYYFVLTTNNFENVYQLENTFGEVIPTYDLSQMTENKFLLEIKIFCEFDSSKTNLVKENDEYYECKYKILEITDSKIQSKDIELKSGYVVANTEKFSDDSSFYYLCLQKRNDNLELNSNEFLNIYYDSEFNEFISYNSSTKNDIVLKAQDNKILAKNGIYSFNANGYDTLLDFSSNGYVLETNNDYSLNTFIFISQDKYYGLANFDGEILISGYITEETGYYEDISLVNDGFVGYYINEEGQYEYHLFNINGEFVQNLDNFYDDKDYSLSFITKNTGLEFTNENDVLILESSNGNYKITGFDKVQFFRETKNMALLGLFKENESEPYLVLKIKKQGIFYFIPVEEQVSGDSNNFTDEIDSYSSMVSPYSVDTYTNIYSSGGTLIASVHLYDTHEGTIFSFAGHNWRIYINTVAGYYIRSATLYVNFAYDYDITFTSTRNSTGGISSWSVDKFSMYTPTVSGYSVNYTIYQNGGSYLGSLNPRSSTYTSGYGKLQYSKYFYIDGSLKYTRYAEYGASYTAPYASRTGYYLSGWTSGGTYSYNGNFSHYGYWNANSYYVSFVANKPSSATNTVSINNSNSNKYYNSGFTVYTPTLLGWTFTGWTITGMDSVYHYYGTSSSNYSGTYSTSLTTSSSWFKNLRSTSGTVTFTANWRVNTYTIYFNTNKPTAASYSATVSPTSRRVNYESYTTMPTPSLKGWTCSGWATSSSGRTTYSCGSRYRNFVTSGSITLYARWTANSYYVQLANTSYMSNYGIGSGSSGLGLTSTTGRYTATFDSTGVFTVSVCRPGYQFAGWSVSNGTSSLIGYKVSASYTNQNNTSQNITVTTTIKNLRTSNSVVTLTANWTPITYTIKYDTNKPSNATSNPTVSPTTITATYGIETTMSTPTLAGWTCNGWSTSSTGNAIYTCGANYSNFTTTKSSTVTLYAKWVQNTYTINFDTNKPTEATSTPSVSPTYISATYEEYYTMPTPTLTGWTCNGWSTSSTGTATYNCVGSYRNFATSGSITLYARWTQNQYYIHYDSNKPSTASGTISGNVADTLATYDATVTLATNSYSLTGWTYLGWSTNRNATSATYSSGQSVSKPNFTSTKNGTYTLYAIWRPNTYNITLDAAGGTISSSSATSGMTGSNLSYTATYDVTGVFANSIKKDGYMFNGWTISTSTGSVTSRPANTSYSSLQSYYDTNSDTANAISVTNTVLNLIAIDGGSVTLTARWTAITYKIYLSSSVSSGSTTANLSIPVDSAISNITLSNSVYTATYDLVGKFKINTNRIGYEFNGWSKSSSNGIVNVNPSAPLVDDTNTSIVVTTEVTNLTTVYNGSVTLTELWTPITYSITLNGNGGTVTSTGTPSGLTNSSYPYTATFDKEGIFNINAVRPGYMFAGWTISTGIGTASTLPSNTGYSSFTAYYSSVPDTANSIGVKTTTLNVSQIRNQTVTLSAVWTPITYNLVYDSARPTSDVYGVNATYSPVGTTPSSTATYDSNSTFSSNVFTLIGWTYLGWSTVPNVTSPQYLSGSTTTSPLNLTTVNGGNVTIYAIWRQNEYTITYNLNNGTQKTGGTYTETAKFDSWFMVSTPIRTGYTFKNYTISTFTTDNQKYYGKSTASFTTLPTTTTTLTNSVNSDYYYKNLISTDGGNITFEASWTANTYNIEYDLTGDESISGSYGDKSPSGQYPTTATYDITFNVSAPVRLGYTFVGWYITNMDTACVHYFGSSTTTASYIDSTMATSFMNLRATGDVTVKFKALWQANVYNISYNYNNGGESDIGVYPTKLTFDTWDTISNPVRVGYTFTGWTISEMSNTCTHYYGTSGSTVQNANQTTSMSITISNVLVVDFLNLHSEADATVIFKANWTPNVYKITYVLGSTGGALGTGIFPTSATYDVPVYIDAPTVYPFGYHFGGWQITGMSTDCTHYYSSNGNDYFEMIGSSGIAPEDSIYFMNLQSNSGATVTLTAIWSPNVYKINYVLTDTKGGDGHFDIEYPLEASYDEQFVVPYPTRTGYTFMGWSLSGLSDLCTHYYSSADTAFESTNGGYYSPSNPNEFIVLKETVFKNLHCETGAVVTLTANWSANSYTITYHYMPSNFDTSILNDTTINSSANMTNTKTQTVLYDSNFTTMKMSKSDSDTTGVVVPSDVKIAYWIFYSTASSSYQVATMDSSGNPTPAHSYYLGIGTEQIFSSYELWGDYDLFGSDVHAYAVYAFVDINLVIYYADSIVNYNNFSNYKQLSGEVLATKTYRTLTLPTRVGGTNVLGFWISSNYYIDGEISADSITKYTLNGVTYEAYAGATILWGYSSTQAKDPENPTFYLYAVYDNSFDSLYPTSVVGSNAISIGTAGVFNEGSTYKITIRGFEASNFYDYSYVKFASSINSTGTANCGFDFVYAHENTTNSNLNLNVVATNSTTLEITFTADANTNAFNLYLVFDSNSVNSNFLEIYKENVTILISEVVPEI